MAPEAVARVQGFPAPEGLVDLEVRAGEVVRLAGPNGVGKTSLLRALAGLDAPLRPRLVEVEGRAPRLLPAADVPARLGWAPEEARDALVGLTAAGEFRLRGRPWPDLDVPAQQASATLSAGEARQVALALAVGRLLLLDEPAEGLDRPARAALEQRIRAARRDGAVVLASHDESLARLADRTVHLGPARPAPLPEVPRGEGPTLVEATAQRVVRGGRTLLLPGLALGPGLHAVVGPIGSGKTTLLERLSGLRDAEGVRLLGRPVRPGDAPWCPAHGADLLAGATVAEDLQGVPEAQRSRWAPGLLERHPLTLSRGEVQRVALAKALARPGRLVLLDEPEAHLDPEGRQALLEAIADRVRRGDAVVVATHDPELAARAQGQVRMAQERTEAP